MGLFFSSSYFKYLHFISWYRKMMQSHVHSSKGATQISFYFVISSDEKRSVWTEWLITSSVYTIVVLRSIWKKKKEEIWPANILFIFFLKKKNFKAKMKQLGGIPQTFTIIFSEKFFVDWKKKKTKKKGNYKLVKGESSQ